MLDSRTPTVDDEIDIRAILQDLWNARVVLIIITFVAAVVAFVVSYWGLPYNYQATAYVFVGAPTIDFVNTTDGNVNITDGAVSTTGIKISPTIPDIKTVVQLATSPGLLENVTQEPRVADAFAGEGISFEVLSGMVSAVDIGTDQVSLSVVDTDAQRAALLANVWAEKVATIVSNTYGFSSVTRNLDAQVLQSKQALAESQSALEEALSRSQVDTLDARLQRGQIDLGCILEKKSQILHVLDDLQILEERLNDLSGETPLLVSDGLILTTLQQFSLTNQSCQSQHSSHFSPNLETSTYVPGSLNFIFQVDSTAFADLTVSKTLEVTSTLRSTLQARDAQLEKEQSRLEQEIPQLKKELENAQFQLSQVSMNKEQSEVLYSNLAELQQRISTMLDQSAKVANVSLQATPPQKPLSRNIVRNTVLAGMAGLMLSAFFVLMRDWWRKSGN
jgi:capsular polysaccharide biosynthesis protein